MKNIKLEKWKSGNRIVVRNNGKIEISKRINKKDFSHYADIYKKYGSIDKNYTRREFRGKRFTEIAVYSNKSNYIPQKPKLKTGTETKTIQYTVMATVYKEVNGKKFSRTIISRSRNSSLGNLNHARNQAYEFLYKRIDEFYHPTHYDADEGKEIVSEKKIKIYEGWVYYKKN